MDTVQGALQKHGPLHAEPIHVGQSDLRLAVCVDEAGIHGLEKAAILALDLPVMSGLPRTVEARIQV